MKLLEGRDEAEHRRVARLSCCYALLLAFFFLIFGKLILWIYGVPLSMVRIVGGIILMRIGFELFSPSSSATRIVGFFVSTMGMGLIFHGVQWRTRSHSDLWNGERASRMNGNSR